MLIRTCGSANKVIACARSVAGSIPGSVAARRSIINGPIRTPDKLVFRSTRCGMNSAFSAESADDEIPSSAMPNWVFSRSATASPVMFRRRRRTVPLPAAVPVPAAKRMSSKISSASTRLSNPPVASTMARRAWRWSEARPGG